MHVPAVNSAGAEVLPSSTPHYSYAYELPSEEEERFEKLFRQLDVNGDGRIDVTELAQSLHIHGVPENLKESYAMVRNNALIFTFTCYQSLLCSCLPFLALQKFIQQSDLNQSGDVTLAEFIHYVREHEKKLLISFSNLDTDRDGRIKVNELVGAFRDLGVAISHKEAARLMKRYNSI